MTEISEYWRTQYERVAPADWGKPCALFSPGPDDDERRYLAAHSLLVGRIEPGDTVLDVGCGYGGFADRLPRGVQYVGLDIVRRTVCAAREQRPGRMFLHGDLSAAVPGSFDFVIALGVLSTICKANEHAATAKARAFVSRLRGVARKGVVVSALEKPGPPGSRLMRYTRGELMAITDNSAAGLIRAGITVPPKQPEQDWTIYCEALRVAAER